MGTTGWLGQGNQREEAGAGGLVEDDQENAPGEVRVEQASKSGEARAQRDKAAAEQHIPRRRIRGRGCGAILLSFSL